MVKKTATASSLAWFDDNKVALPRVGDYIILQNGYGKPIAVLRELQVEVTAFDEISEEHAFLKGEGNRSLTYWR
ncbi:hypothetical protein Hs30E_07030 [Lactococcus hodotermopsidis]|uniref:ASCH domain-containing protein n=1 Tax=Pseudolactococcus hodotermopsidis TaxID=2709157 RepID=A0A6A0B9V2_9LACT|nr:ASCH domain-containing protein [Lactococcus hodotermopsidis]GFH42152.1 hypothetical protein Hs30E_07030 [Lactococcus hodotermopsidis]